MIRLDGHLADQAHALLLNMWSAGRWSGLAPEVSQRILTSLVDAAYRESLPVIVGESLRDFGGAL
jgi:hypothetical protein